MSILKKLKKNKIDVLFITILLLTFLFLVSRNYTKGTFLTGWDNEHFEFNIWLNLERLLSSSWAEYQGLGSPGAHSHASDIPRIFITGILDLLLPDNLVRYAYIFLSLVVGTLGVYFLVSKRLIKDRSQKLNSLAGFASGLIYMLHVGTIQHFIVPFEMFQTQYAMLPLIFIYLIKYLDSGRKKHKFILSLLILFSAPMAYAVMLWAAFFGSIVIFLGIENASQFIKNKRDKRLEQRTENQKTSLASGSRYMANLRKRSLFIVTALVLINSFWLFNTIYYVFNYSSLVPEAKTNKIFSEEAFLTNKKYGNIWDIALHKGFLFEWNIRTPDTLFEPLMKDWDSHLSQTPITVIAVTFFLITILGIILSVYRKQKYSSSFLGIYIFGIIMLLGTNPPFGFIFNIFLTKIPALEEALRFPFTKFSILVLFTQSIFFGFGIYYIAKLIRKYFDLNPIILLAPCLVFVFYLYAVPAFQGHLIHKTMRLSIPDDYFETFKFFEEQDPNTRIANLPIDRLFGWFYTDWGYQGSGFLWYGIKQPILDRDFDRWYSYNEDYYDEMTTAIYTGDRDYLKEILIKYQIDWILIDKSVDAVDSNSIHLDSLEEDRFGNRFPRDLAFNESEELLESINGIKLERVIGKISIYKVNLDNDSSFVDVARRDDELGEGLSYYPITTTNLERKNGSVEITNNDSAITIKKDLAVSLSGGSYIDIPQYYDKETKIFANVSVKKDEEGYLIINLDLLNPEIKVDDTILIPDRASDLIIKSDTPLAGNSFILTFDGSNYLKASNVSLEEKQIGETFVDLTSDTKLSIFDARDVVAEKLPIDFSNLTSSNCLNEKLNSNNTVTIGINKLDLKTGSGNICVQLELTKALKRNSLIETTFDYSSKSGSEPDLCIRNPSTCSDVNSIFYQKEKNGTYNYKTYATAENSNRPVFLDLVLNDTRENDTDAINYSNFDLKLYPKIYNATIDSNVILKALKFDVQVIKINKNARNIYFTFRKSPIVDLEINDLQNIFGNSITNCKENVSGGGEITYENGELLITSRDAYNCKNINLFNIPTDLGYLIDIDSRNYEGSNLVVSLNDFSYRKSFYLDRPSDEDSKIFLMPKISFTKSPGFNIFLNNQSIGGEETKNGIKDITITPIGYNFLRGIKIFANDQKLLATSGFKVTKFANFLYKVEFPNQNDKYIITLNQSFEKNWQTFGGNAKRLQFNNLTNVLWPNYWEVSNSKSLYLIYVPQVFTYIGFALSGMFIYHSFVTYVLTKLRKNGK